MKNACLPKISILLQFGGEIYSDDSIQTLLILPQFLSICDVTLNDSICQP